MTTSILINNQIEIAFREVQAKHMQDMPVINPKLSVKTFGFSEKDEFNDHLLGILVTPWFMNLMLIPRAEPKENAPQMGSIHKHTFPSGTYDFVAGYDDVFGHYQSCSLFSPMFEFDSQEAAELTAQSALIAVMNEKNKDLESESRSQEIEQIWNGEKPKSSSSAGFSNEPSSDEPAPKKKLLSERAKEPTSRRDFLRGKIFRSSDADT